MTNISPSFINADTPTAFPPVAIAMTGPGGLVPAAEVAEDLEVAESTASVAPAIPDQDDDDLVTAPANDPCEDHGEQAEEGQSELAKAKCADAEFNDQFHVVEKLVGDFKVKQKTEKSFGDTKKESLYLSLAAAGRFHDRWYGKEQYEGFLSNLGIHPAKGKQAKTPYLMTVKALFEPTLHKEKPRTRREKLDKAAREKQVSSYASSLQFAKEMGATDVANFLATFRNRRGETGIEAARAALAELRREKRTVQKTVSIAAQHRYEVGLSRLRANMTDIRPDMASI